MCVLAQIMREICVFSNPSFSSCACLLSGATCFGWKLCCVNPFVEAESLR